MLLAFILLCQFTTIRLQDQTIRAELAQTQQEQIKGLQGRKDLPENEGMLFVYQKPQLLQFWMKGVKIPLSIGFFDENRVLVNIEEMPLAAKWELSPKLYLSRKPALYALEMPSGWFKRHQIELGTRFEWSDEFPIHNQ